jgi:hypothetical protein
MKLKSYWLHFLSLMLFFWFGNISWACSMIPPKYYWDEWKNGKSLVLQSLLKQGVKTTTSDRLTLKVPKVSRQIVLADYYAGYPEDAFLRQLLEVTKWNARITNQAPFEIIVGTLRVPQNNLGNFGLNLALESISKILTPNESYFPNLFPFWSWCPMSNPSSWFTHKIINIKMANTHFVIFGKKSQNFRYDLIQNNNFRSDSEKIFYFRDFETFVRAFETSDATVAMLIRLTGNLGVLQRKFEVIKLTQVTSIGKQTNRRRR